MSSGRVDTLYINKDFSSFQDGIKRFESAMEGIPDRVPVVTQMHEFAMKELGIAASRFYTTPEVLAAGTLEIQEKYGIDVPVLDYDVYNIEAEALGQEVTYSDIDMPDVDRTKPLIRNRDDFCIMEEYGRLSERITQHGTFNPGKSR
jgi:uroporphyrinogen-III decarboxylase